MGQRAENFGSALEAIEGEKKFGDEALAHLRGEAGLR